MSTVEDFADTNPTSPEPAGSAPFDEVLASARAALAIILAQVDEAKSAAASVLQSQSTAAAALSDIQTKATDAGSVASAAIGAKTQIEDAQSVIATKAEHIEEARKHADGVRAQLDRALMSANLRATEAESLKERTQTAADNATTNAGALQILLGTATGESSNISLALAGATECASKTRSLAEKAGKVEEKITGYELRLSEIQADSSAQLQTILKLLPGATSAGLATAFNKRRKTFLMPLILWQALFIASVLALVALTGWTLLLALKSPTPLTYDELIRLFLSRLPVVGALVWLALHAGREAALANRLEEDYAYKAAIAESFEGFNKQMAGLDGSADGMKPLATLCQNTLAAIAAPPGRIYDGHQLTISPFNELAESVKNLTSIVKEHMPKNPSA